MAYFGRICFFKILKDFSFGFQVEKHIFAPPLNKKAIYRMTQ